MKVPLVSGFGSIVVDVLMSSDGIALDKKNFVQYQTIQVGGVIPTALMTLARLGISTQFHSVVGDDLFGDALHNMSQKEHVQTDGLRRISKEKTPLAFVVVSTVEGKRTSFYTTGAFSATPQSDLTFPLDPNTSHLIVDGHNRDETIKLIHQAKKQQTVIMLDLGSPKEGIETLIPFADGIIVPQAYWKSLWGNKTPEEISRILLQKGPSIVVLTMEEKGCLVADHSTLFHRPSFPVRAVDTNGAGDVFFGTFMYGLIQKWSLSKVAQFACAAAAKSCTIIGKEGKIPKSTAEIETFIKANR